jgi:ABC-type lipoprotein export system ATPase subunit
MIKLVNVSKYYNSNGVVALGLRKVNLELGANEFVAIVGESGSGKTTLLNVICGIDSYEEGEIFVNGEETSYFSSSDLEDYRKRYVAFVFQNYNLIDAYTVLQNVMAPMLLSGTPDKEAKQRALEIIRRVGLEKHANHKATKLSGGQKQRVVIARALAKDCPIIAADEPTGNLDSESSRQIMELLREISKDKLVIVVTHEFDQVREHATRKLRMFDGELVEDLELKHVEKGEIVSNLSIKTRLNPLQNAAIALRNLASVPKKSLLMVIIFAFFSFFVALSYGGFLNSMRDFDYSYNQFFQNTSISRVIVRKADKSAFTPADLAELEALDNVRSVVANDYLLDLQSYYSIKGGNEWENAITTMFLPLDIATEDDLLFGVMPEAANEVLLALPDNQMQHADTYLGQTIVENSYGMGRVSTYQELVVVGIVNASTYFMEIKSYGNTNGFLLVGEAARDAFAAAGYFNYLIDSSFVGENNSSEDVLVVNILNNYPILTDATVPVGRMILPSEFSWQFCAGAGTCTADGMIRYADFYRTGQIPDLHVTFEAINDYSKYGIRVHPSVLSGLLDDEVYQVSLITASDIGVNTLIRRAALIMQTPLQPKYKLFYPYQSEAPDPFTAFLTIFNIIGATILLVVTIAASTLISFLIFKAIINTKMRDYAIFRTIGANQSLVTNMIYLENVFAAVAAYLIMVVLIVFLKQPGSLLVEVLKYYNVMSLLVLFGFMMLMAVLISRRYCRKIFQETVQKTLKTE